MSHLPRHLGEARARRSSILLGCFGGSNSLRSCCLKINGGGLQAGLKLPPILCRADLLLPLQSCILMLELSNLSLEEKLLCPGRLRIEIVAVRSRPEADHLESTPAGISRACDTSEEQLPVVASGDAIHDLLRPGRAVDAWGALPA